MRRGRSLPALGGAGEYREIAYNVSDVINKVGFGLVAYAGIKALSSGEAVANGFRTEANAA